jgi:hypothetical protein
VPTIKHSPIASDEHLLPRPRRVRFLPGVHKLHSDGRTSVSVRGGDAAKRAARLLRSHLVDASKLRGGGGKRAAVGQITIEHASVAEQAYSLRVRPDGIRLRAGDRAGFQYGVTTLTQLIAPGCRAVRAMDIEDRPDFAARGVMLDISRDKVPTLASLKRLIDMLAGWKINQLQLYTEHTFAYAGHEEVWHGASPLTGSQIKELDRYCRERCVELAPNQNSFGHMERWLCHEPYAQLAETHEPWETPWGEVRRRPSTLNPLARGSIQLMASLYEQLLPHFTSRLFNVGCDETFELGQGASRRACERHGTGRVYLEFLLKLHRIVRRHGRRMMFWADIAFQHPELLAELPDDVVPLIWGYEADHPFAEQCARLAECGLEFYVCPGTSSWCSFGGRTQNCLANLRKAAASGRRHGASGYLIADWGDYGHRQYQPASYCGFLYGAAVSWCGKTNREIDVAREVSRHAFGDESGLAGRPWHDLGNVHEVSGILLRNKTVLFSCMQAALEDPQGLAGLNRRKIDVMERRIAKLRSQARGLGCGGRDGGLVREELLATLDILRHACRRAGLALAMQRGQRDRRTCRWLASDMARIMRCHRRLWPMRNRRGGLASSMAYYRRNLREYEAALGQ